MLLKLMKKMKKLGRRKMNFLSRRWFTTMVTCLKGNANMMVPSTVTVNLLTKTEKSFVGIGKMVEGNVMAPIFTDIQAETNLTGTKKKGSVKASEFIPGPINRGIAATINKIRKMVMVHGLGQMVASTRAISKMIFFMALVYIDGKMEIHGKVISRMI